MRYSIRGAAPRQLPNIENALKILDHHASIVPESDRPDLRLTLEYCESPDLMVRVVSPDLPEPGGVWEYRDREIEDHRYHREDRPQRLKELIRLGIIRVVGGFLGTSPPWGILSGVRPAKIFHYLRDKGFSAAEIRDKLVSIYGLIPEKADLLVEIGVRQEACFNPPRDLVGIYLGIPFCPTRCQYCSFAAVSLETHSHQVQPFLNALDREVAAVADLCGQLGLAIDTLYIGGGTPTSLDEASFGHMIFHFARAFVTTPLREFTVEAGRPETITPEKLALMKEAGVTRISVNPQSMNQATLDRIGRRHTVDQIREAVRMVREQTDFLLNMDLILGLPGERGADFLESLKQVLELEPENITIHTLAPKRAAAWNAEFDSMELAAPPDLKAAAAKGLTLVKACGFHPYYLYRQRHILADLENIGLAKNGSECLYNIRMMEERQTILGLGGGAITKWVFPPAYRVARLQNPKCPATYVRRLEELIVKKAQQSRILLG